MKNLFAFTQFGFIALTLVCYAILLALLNRALRESNLPEERKQNIYRGTIAGLVLWLLVFGLLDQIFKLNHHWGYRIDSFLWKEIVD